MRKTPQTNTFGRTDNYQRIDLSQRTYQQKKSSRTLLLVTLLIAVVGIIGGSLLVNAALSAESSRVSDPVSDTRLTPEDQPATNTQANSETPSENLPVDADAPRIYLTFDDGPSAESTQKVLEILDTYNIKATFFMLGSQAEDRPDMVRLVASKGHVIANHSYSHDYDSLYVSADAFMNDIQHNEDILTGILGERPARILRFPAGSIATQLENNPAIREGIKQKLTEGGWRYFDWNASMGDSRTEAPAPGELGQNLINYMEEQILYGTTSIVVLAHDTDSRPWTPADLPMVIEHCLAKGYVFETLSADSPPCEYR